MDGVPDMTPEFRANPAGRAPALMDHEYGGVPPEAEQVAVKGTIDVGPAEGVQDMVSGGAVLPAMIKVAALEPIVPGFTTVMAAEPAEAVRAAGTVAVNWVALIHVVVSAAPFHWTTEPGSSCRVQTQGEMKLEPFTVRVRSDPPATTEEGLRPEIAGTSGVTVTFAIFEPVPAGYVLNTWNRRVPGGIVRSRGTATVSCVELTKVVGRTFNATGVAGASGSTTDAPETKPLPVTVRVTVLPCGTLAGEMLLIEGPTGPTRAWICEPVRLLAKMRTSSSAPVNGEP